MFFRRERPKKPTFSQRLDNLRQAGFTVQPGPDGYERVSRNGFAIDLQEKNDMVRAGGRAGVLLHGDIAWLVDGGYQKFFRTGAGKQMPALAQELKGLHDFEEDVKEGLGEDSYYNESLGTVSTYYLYDRVQDRDRGVPKRVWE